MMVMIRELKRKYLSRQSTAFVKIRGGPLPSLFPNDRVQPRAKRRGCDARLAGFAFTMTGIALRSRP
jgi:hypothetical protein